MLMFLNSRLLFKMITQIPINKSFIGAQILAFSRRKINWPWKQAVSGWKKSTFFIMFLNKQQSRSIARPTKLTTTTKKMATLNQESLIHTNLPPETSFQDNTFMKNPFSSSKRLSHGGNLSPSSSIFNEARKIYWMEFFCIS